ncbi:PfkB family carbohydrate kinase [Mangrovivirga sp. M17]|uniref:PfkB family carbohydrate kinase n=1 Tax=Mangrovivirga halotolerans TaxID=2993936 RepID=A0ABT3RRJ1_9BACT|nr:PfkB family carbohydrate kinase [Mangrovivirga halotolerans]MCX2743887.1 PfkB family carbohydrate kinase [Mangrovivirga halotolerans]
MIKDNRKIKVVTFGEVLWDVFEGNKKIGGAPLNVALTMQSLGADVSIISGIGSDHNGEELLNIIHQDINVDHIQKNKNLATSTVDVQLDENKQATYIIHQPVAWDEIMFSEKLKNVVDGCDIFIFGSLSSRSEMSSKTLIRLLDNDAFNVLDINLRAPHYTSETLLGLTNAADFVKFNDKEIEEVIKLVYGQPFEGIEEAMKYISLNSGVDKICVTRGDKGAVLYSDGDFFYNPGYNVEVVDTVGAGDSFLGALVLKIYEGEDPQKALDFASAMGAYVCSKQGANPEYNENDIEEIMGMVK